MVDLALVISLGVALIFGYLIRWAQDREEREIQARTIAEQGHVISLHHAERLTLMRKIRNMEVVHRMIGSTSYNEMQFPWEVWGDYFADINQTDSREQLSRDYGADSPTRN